MARTKSDFDVRSRSVRLGVMLARGDRMTSALIRATFKVSRATAKRDMTMIEAALPVRTEVTAGSKVVITLPPENSVERVRLLGREADHAA